MYDIIVGDEVRNFYAFETIQLAGIENIIEVSRVEGIVNTADFQNLCNQFFSQGGAHIVIISPDASVLLLVYQNVCMSLLIMLVMANTVPYCSFLHALTFP